MDEDELARMRAASDQAKAGLVELAGNLWTFFEELREQGFDESQAMFLCVTFLQTGMENGLGGGDE